MPSILKHHAFVFLAVSCAITDAHADHVADHQCVYNTPGYMLNRFVDNSDGTVTDRYTSLMWQRCNLGTSWDSASSQCATGNATAFDWKTTLSLVQQYNQEQAAQGKHSDWRLPNIKELASIVNVNCSYPAAFTSIFPDVTSGYWSSTPDITSLVLTQPPNSYYEHGVWTVNFQTGRESITGEAVSHPLYARLVRDNN